MINEIGESREQFILSTEINAFHNVQRFQKVIGKVIRKYLI